METDNTGGAGIPETRNRRRDEQSEETTMDEGRSSRGLGNSAKQAANVGLAVFGLVLLLSIFAGASPLPVYLACPLGTYPPYYVTAFSCGSQPGELCSWPRDMLVR
jgi:hypothetical protein